jgi:hypothetical protein
MRIVLACVLAFARLVVENRRAAPTEQQISPLDEMPAEKTARDAHVAWSALDCWARERRAQAKAAIQEERQYAEEGGGIVDMAKLYGMQDKMRFADKLIAAAKTHLESLKRRRLSCDDPAVRVAASCYVSADAPCDADKFDLYVGITRAETERAAAAVFAR